jgi:rubrerythrin
MGFKSKGGKYFANPAVGRQHDRDAEAKPVAREPEIDDGEPGKGKSIVHKVEIHAPDSVENPSPGQHHTVTTDADGNEEHADHASAEEAHQHAGEAMGVGEDHDLGGEQEDDPEAQAEICPECGAEMQGGTCPECGYTDDKGAIAGQHEEEQDPGDHEYR